MHLDDERLQRLLHRELPPRDEAKALEHVAACDECRRLLDAAKREEEEILGLLRLVDRPSPLVQAEAIAQRARDVPRIARRPGSGWIRRAAALILAVGIAGLAYAIPGSPVRRWVREVAQTFLGRSGGSAPDQAGTSASGISVPPGPRLSIRFIRAAGAGSLPRAAEVRVSLIDGPEVQIEAPAGSATFTSTTDQILVAAQDSSAVFEIRIPRPAPWVEIRDGDERVFLKEGPRITNPGHKSGLRVFLPKDRAEGGHDRN